MAKPPKGKVKSGISSIANAIRNNGSISQRMTIDEMPGLINSLTKTNLKSFYFKDYVYVPESAYNTVGYVDRTYTFPYPIDISNSVVVVMGDIIRNGGTYNANLRYFQNGSYQNSKSYAGANSQFLISSGGKFTSTSIELSYRRVNARDYDMDFYVDARILVCDLN